MRAPPGYTLLKELGRGGFGAVWRARSPQGAEVALKLVTLSGLDAAERQRFEREVQALMRVRAPGLVRLLDAGFTADGPWLAMELIPGQTLSAVMARSGQLEPALVADLARSLTKTLEALHAQGVVHRDLKPQNVMLGPDGQPVLLDLGLALLLDHSQRLTRTGEILGTPAYMAPEQAQGDPGRVGPACDVYGLGAISWALLCGRAPYEGGSPLAVLQELLAGSPAPVRRLRPDVDPRLDALIAACLRQEPLARPSLAQVRAALEDLERRPRRKRPGLLLAGVGGAAVAVGVLWLAVAPRSTPQPDPAWSTAAGPDPASVVSTLVSAGLELLDRGDLAGAAQRLEQAVHERPADARAWAALARTRQAQGDLSAASQAVERALALDGRSALALATRGALALERGDPQGALADLERALELEPAGESYYLRAMAWLRLKRPADALSDLDRALQRAPDFATALAMRAQVRRNLHHPDWQADLDHAVALAGREPGPFVIRAQMREEQRDLPGALEDLDRAVGVAPHREDVRLIRAGLRRRSGDLPGAVEDLRQAIALSPPDGGERAGLQGELDDVRADQAMDPGEASRAHLRQAMGPRGGDPEAVLRELDLALALDPTRHEARVLRGRLLQQTGRLGPALQDLDLAVQQAPRDPVARAFRGLTLAALRRDEEALADAERALAERPNLPTALMLRGELRLSRNDAQGALEDFQAAMRAEPDRSDHRLGAARALLVLRREPEARRALEEVLGLQPDEPSALALRGILRLQEGERAGLSDLAQAQRADPRILRRSDLRTPLERLRARSEPELAERLAELLGPETAQGSDPGR